MININWAKLDGLLPVVVQDFEKIDVLMLAYMNEEAFNLTLNSGFAHYFSRTKKRIWKKGEESGNIQIVKSMSLDCDGDALLLKVEQKGGVACHTGARSCFFNEIEFVNSHLNSDVNSLNSKPKYNILDEIYHVILDRKLNADPNSSYVAKLYKKGENAYLKKICEEASEFTFAIKDLSKFSKYKNLKLENFGEHKVGEPDYDAVYEAADLIFHVLVALAAFDIHPSRILDELRRREGISGIEEKNARND